jgi:hypothetical protein
MKQLIVSIICLPLAGMLLFEIWRGLKTGKIRHSDSTSYFNQKTQPICFWLVIFVFFAFALIFLYTIYKSIA